jgi:hypothetical protein
VIGYPESITNYSIEEGDSFRVGQEPAGEFIMGQVAPPVAVHGIGQVAVEEGYNDATAVLNPLSIINGGQK